MLTTAGAWITSRKHHPLADNWKNWYQLAVFPVGAFLIKRGVSGYRELNNRFSRNTAESNRKSFKISKEIYLDKPRSEAYKIWRKLSDLPNVFSHVKEVKNINGRTIQCVVTNPADQQDIVWNAKLKDDAINERVTWESVEGSDLEVKGEASFFDSNDGNGTDVEIVLRYTQPEGKVENSVAELFTKASRKSMSQG